MVHFNTQFIRAWLTWHPVWPVSLITAQVQHGNQSILFVPFQTLLENTERTFKITQFPAFLKGKSNRANCFKQKPKQQKKWQDLPFPQDKAITVAHLCPRVFNIQLSLTSHHQQSLVSWPTVNKQSVMNVSPGPGTQNLTQKLVCRCNGSRHLDYRKKIHCNYYPLSLHCTSNFPSPYLLI